MTDSFEALPFALEYISRWLSYQVRETAQPGCSIAIRYKGELQLEDGFGYADLTTMEPLTPRHRFRVASHSKSFAAAAIMKLRQQQRVRLDDTVGSYVGGLHPDIAAATVAQVLSHTAGISRDGLDIDYFYWGGPFPDAARLRNDLSLPPSIEANTRLKYSNLGYGLIGLLIESITGERYSTWLEREIIGAIALLETTADAPPAAGAMLARGHSSQVLMGRRILFQGNQVADAVAAAGGVVSTATDLSRFFYQLSSSAPDSVLSAASRREMLRPQWRAAYETEEISYGLGIMFGAFNGWDWYGHGGGWAGYVTRTAVVPSQDLAISVLTNAYDGMAGLWLAGILSILQRFRQEGAPREPVTDWSGRWWSISGAVDLVPLGEKVLLATPAQPYPLLFAPELDVIGPDEARIKEASAFHFYGESVSRVRDMSGKIVEVHVAAEKLLPETVLADKVKARERS